jgi:hypothetical protein
VGVEAKEDARRLLKESHDHEVITACLNLVGVEAKEDALRLLKESKDHQVISVCLNLLGVEAKEDACRLLKESKNMSIISACLKVLGSDARDEATEILNHWMSKPRFLVAAALKAFTDDPDSAEMYCRDILNNWERDIEYSIRKQKQKYSGHIVTSLAHPKLGKTAKIVASAMLKKEQQATGFLGQLLFKSAQAISQGKILVWGQDFDPQSD